MASQGGETTQQVLDRFREEGTEGRQVDIQIGYNILHQFSSQLYNNPRRAIEELVCNSYDAYATECYVSTPKDEDDVLQVLDNGVSMSDEGLDRLWDVAGGPKHEAVVEGRERKLEGRKQIGRFGVGKLAAFALGGELTHVATLDSVTRIISVSKDQIGELDDGETPSSRVYEMDEERARDYLGDYLDGIKDPWEEDWESWTLAVVDNIAPENTGRELRAENLDRMIRTAIPLSTNFTVYRNGVQVSERKYPAVKEEMDAAEDEEFRSKLSTELQAFWVERSEEFEDPDDVPAELTGITTTEVEPYEDSNDAEKGIRVEKLGSIVARGAIYESTLTPDKLEEQDIYDHGFKLRVRGKLLNRDDPLFGISQRSHAFWNAFRGEFEMPDLDDEILVQRNEVKDGVKKDLAQLVMKSFFNTLRNRAEESEERKDPGTFGHRLHTLSPFVAAEALEGLTEEDDEYPASGWDDVDVKLAEMGRGGDAVRYVSSDQTIYINDEHPLFEALGETKDLPSEIRKVIGEALAGSEIAKGYLTYYDVNKDIVDKTKEISETALEIAAGYIQDPFQYYIEHIEKMSHEGDDVFEIAIADALNQIGVETQKHGGRGESDAIITLPREDTESLRISIEAKGKEEGKVSHGELNISTAREHMKEDDCNHTLVVAREFVTESPPGEDGVSKFLNQLRMYEDVSALDVPALQRVLENHREKPYPHPQLDKILTNQKDPDELIEFIDELSTELPAEKHIIREVLETAYEIQRDDKRAQRLGLIMAEVDIDDHEIETILRSVQISTGGMVTVRDDGRYFSIHQTPDQILDAM